MRAFAARTLYQEQIMEQKRERIWELDALRGFCIVCVIFVQGINLLKKHGALPTQPKSPDAP